MDAALIASAAMLGLAGAPHCTAMCGATCAAVSGHAGRAGWLSFHALRVLGYAAAGGVVAASAGALATISQASPALRPLWTLLHMAALALGLWLLWQGRQPAWLGRVGLGGRSTQPGADAVMAVPAGWQRVRGPLRAGLAGGLWVGWPCGLLHSALLVAAMTQTAAAGAAAMAGFAVASSAGLLWGPWLWARIGQRRGAQAAEGWAARLAGLMLVAASGFALGHGLWHEVAVFCGWA
jgi:sulfite exporter TauE/SafE